MFDIVDTAFSYERELIVCSFLQDFSKGKESSLQLICKPPTAFYFVRRYHHTGNNVIVSMVTSTKRFYIKYVWNFENKNKHCMTVCIRFGRTRNYLYTCIWIKRRDLRIQLLFCCFEFSHSLKHFGTQPGTFKNSFSCLHKIYLRNFYQLFVQF